MESLFLKIRHIAHLLLDSPIIVSSLVNPVDAVTGLGEIRKGLY